MVEIRSIPRDGRRRLVGIVVLVSTLLGLLSFAYMALDEAVRGRDVPFTEPLVEELTGAYAGALLFFAVLALARRRPLRWTNALERLPVYLAVMLAFSVAHTSLNWLLRSIAFPVLGLGAYDYGAMPLRYLMELPKDVIAFWLMVGAIHAWDRYRESREREVRTAQLESELARAELDNLRLQLEPHFLFNALNAVSEKMYEDPAAADAMIGRLSEMLRRTLRTVHAHEIPLEEEIEGLRIYAELLRARFGEGVRLAVETDPRVADVRVPALLLQPLVENSVRHGEIGSNGDGRTIKIRARPAGARLALDVLDNGRGAPVAVSRGTGLTVTAERLRLLYGPEHAFEFGNRVEGGFRVSIRLPLRRP
ncbi:MAG: histidine kinase [Gemmatimonadota bacterium]|nr:histidine kinase [Gemmatimonadota bacterium]